MAPGTSLVGFMNQTDGGDGKTVYWGRAAQDGAPFRSAQDNGPPILREEEYEQRVTKVGDPRIDIFDSRDTVQLKAYQEVLNKCVNGQWGQILFVDRRFIPETGSWLIYVEWVTWYMEDGGKEAAQRLQLTGPTNEQHQPSENPTLPPGFSAASLPPVG